jgi:hypothetical protein
VAGFPDLCNCRPFGNNKKCQAGISLFYIDRQGYIFPCASQKRGAPLFYIDDAISHNEMLSINSSSFYLEHCMQDKTLTNEI